MNTFTLIRATAILILVGTSLLAACGEPSDTPEPTEPPSAAASPEVASPSPTIAERSDTPATPGASQATLSAPIVVPLDPDGGEQYRLYLIDTDGSAPRRLTPENSEIIGAESAPVWSPDGQRIVFVGYVGDGVDLFTINADGSDLRNLTNVGEHVIQPEWSPDGAQIVYIRTSADSSDIYVMDADGANNRRLTNGIGPDGSSKDRITPDTGNESEPVWSPDGSWIAYLRVIFVPEDDMTPDPAATPATEDTNSGVGSRAAEGEFETSICLMRPDGSDQRVLTTVHFAAGLQWSPDGRHLAFSTYGTFYDNQHAQVIATDGSGQRTIDNGTVETSLPRWAPDGSSISLVSTDPGGSDLSIVIMDADGTDAHSISQIAGWHAWSPDGSQILITQERITVDGSATGRAMLYLVDVRDANQPPVLLLDDVAIGGYPAWRPIP